MHSKLPVSLLLNTSIQSPGLVLSLSKGLLRKHIGTACDYIAGSGKALRPPYQISIRITNSCNHHCAVCGQYGTKGYMLGVNGKKLAKTLSLETYKNLVDQVSNYKPLFYITGGEPFLYPGIIELMNYIKSKGCVASIVTNGVFLEKYAETIVKNKWDMIMVSFDGPKEIHDKCRNFEGAYDTAVKGILKINEMKKKYHSTLPFVLTSTTLSRLNAPYLEDTFEIGKMLNPSLMVVYLSWFTSKEIGEKQARLLQSSLGITPFTWQSYAAKFSKADGQQFKKQIAKIKHKNWPFPYLIIPDIKVKDIDKYYLDPAKMFGYSKCVAPFIMVDIMPNGDVTTCRDFIDVKVGNITEKPLLKIWNDPKFVRFRKLLIDQGGLLPQCSRCCGLMGF